MQRDASKIKLAPGMHQTANGALCLLEAAAWLAGEAHSDHPACVDPVIAGFGRRLNDSVGYMAPELLPRLTPLVVEIIGTNTNVVADSITRGYMAVDWAARVVVPASLRARAEREHNSRFINTAEWLEGMKPIVDAETAGSARTMLRKIRDEAAGATTATCAVALVSHNDYDNDKLATSAGDAAYTAAVVAEDVAIKASVSAAAEAAEQAGSTADIVANYNAAIGAIYADPADPADVAAATAARGAQHAIWEKLLPSAIDLIRRMCAVGCVRNENAA